MIDAYSFGAIVINGVRYTRDIKIIRDSVKPEWWRKNGHQVEADDINDILNEKIDILLLGAGNPGLMKATPELKTILHEKAIELIEVPTAEAVTLYNQLMKEKKKIAAGFHLTC